MSKIIEALASTSYLNREAIEGAGSYICFHCQKTGTSTAETIDNSRTVLCEHCGIDSCIPIPAEGSRLLNEINTNRFGTFTAMEDLP